MALKQSYKWPPEEMTLFGTKFRKSDFMPKDLDWDNRQILPVLGREFPLAADPEQPETIPGYGNNTIGYGRFVLSFKEDLPNSLRLSFINRFRPLAGKIYNQTYYNIKCFRHIYSTNLYALNERNVETFLQTVAFKYFSESNRNRKLETLVQNALVLLGRTEWGEPGKRALSVLANVCSKERDLDGEYAAIPIISATQLAGFFLATGRLPTIHERHFVSVKTGLETDQERTLS